MHFLHINCNSIKLLFLKKIVPTNFLEWSYPFTYDQPVLPHEPGIEVGGLQSMGSQRAGHGWRDWAHKHTRRPQEELGWSKFWKQLGVTVSGLEDWLLQIVSSENKAGQTGGMSCSWTTLRKQRQKFGSEPHSSSWLLGEGQNGGLNSI